MSKFGYFTVCKADWQVTSYGDLGAYGGLGGSVKHMRFKSPSSGHGLHAILLQGGAGVEVQISCEILTFLNSTIQNMIKAKEGATAESNYKKLNCRKAFSIADIIGSIVTSFNESVTVGVGLKVGGLRVDSSGGPAGPGLLFTIPAEVENDFGFGGGVSAQTGIIIGVGSQFYDYNMEQRFLRELNRRPTDPVIRDPGGF